MFTIENIIGDIVFLSFRDKTFLSKLAISEEASHFKILGQDQLGLWVEHPKLTFRYTTDKDGNPIPEDKQKLQEVEAILSNIRPMRILPIMVLHLLNY